MGIPLEDRLTTQELAVLRLVCSGRSNAEIGSELALSESTAKAHVSSLLRKFGVANRAHLAARAVALGIASPEGGQ